MAKVKWPLIAVLAVLGLVWLGQGIGLIGGSFMTWTAVLGNRRSRDLRASLIVGSQLICATIGRTAVGMRRTMASTRPPALQAGGLTESERTKLPNDHRVVGRKGHIHHSLNGSSGRVALHLNSG